MRSWCIVFCLLVAMTAYGAEDDYDHTKMPSLVARKAFGAIATNLTWQTVARGEAQHDDSDGAYFTEDGGISVPPGGVIAFKNAGKCMDAHLPAPAAGEPMQFIGKGQLINSRLRTTYDRLLERQSQGDPRVAKNNLQHLVWALRLAGTDDPIVDNLSDSQREFLDDCSGRRGGFTKFHEREKRRNARGRLRRTAGNRISVGNVSYDAADLSGTNGTQRIISHMAALTEMGEKSTVRSDSDFRYGEIEENFYSDVMCDGGLSFSARVLNSSQERKVFCAADFAAQVGNGNSSGGQRQRVTMTTPNQFSFARDAVVAGTDFSQGISIADIEIVRGGSSRSTTVKRRRARSASGVSSSSGEVERKVSVSSSGITDISVIPDMPPIPSMTAVTNVVVRPVDKDVRVRVVSVNYDETTQTGIMLVEIVQGSFRAANRHVRVHFKELMRDSEKGISKNVLPDLDLVKIVAISIREDGLLEMRYRVGL